MKKVLIYSLLLIAGLVLSQFIGDAGGNAIKLMTMFALSFIMIHVGYEFEIDKSRPRQYVWDYFVAFTAAAFPWIFCALYIVYVMLPPEAWSSWQAWKESLLLSRFAAPTSAGVLFSMLAAAGLAATWVFRKARILAIFDDLDTILLMIPLKIMMVGFKWQLAAIVLVIVVLLWMAWRYLHRLRLPVTWPFVMLYAGLITAVAEVVYLGSKLIDAQVPVHLEVLLPAFVLGCMLAYPKGANPHANDALENTEHGPAHATEQRVSTLVSACFMVLVGLSMPAIFTQAAPTTSEDIGLMPMAFDTPAPAATTPAAISASQPFPGWGAIAFHVLVITLLANLGKMFPAFVYRREAPWQHRLAVAVGMFPRGEVGAGVLVISLSYNIGGPALTVAVLSLALNLLLTGVFILIVKRLIASAPEFPAQTRSEPTPHLQAAR